MNAQYRMICEVKSGKRFNGGKKKKAFAVSESGTYFSWYIAEEINKSSNTMQ